MPTSCSLLRSHVLYTSLIVLTYTAVTIPQQRAFRTRHTPNITPHATYPLPPDPCSSRHGSRENHPPPSTSYVLLEQARRAGTKTLQHPSIHPRATKRVGLRLRPRPALPPKTTHRGIGVIDGVGFRWFGSDTVADHLTAAHSDTHAIAARTRAGVTAKLLSISVPRSADR